MSETAPPLSAAQVRRFRAEGYLKYGRVLEMDAVEVLRAALDREIRLELEAPPRPGLPPEFAYGHARHGEQNGDRPRAIHQFVNIWKVAPEFREAIRLPRVTAAVRQLMGAREVRLWHDQVISKPPGDNAHFACHHDFYFWPLDRPAMVTCWLALDRATAASGCMHVVPGSHRDPRFQPPDCDLSADLHLDPRPRGPGAAPGALWAAPGSLYDEVRTWGADRATPVELQPGECMFHHCLNYHLTPANVTSSQRRAFVMIYMPDGTRLRRERSPQHPCTRYLELEDGAKLEGEGFPVC